MSSKCRKDSDNCHHHIYVTNNSNSAVYVSASFNYPDTSIIDPNPALGGDYHKVNPYQTATPISRSSCFEDVFRDEISSGVLQLFVLEASVIESTPWDTVKRNYLILKRYDLSLQDLKNKNFRITYP